ncbi:hypothetical protein M758_6G083100 [Ceratodon purpureus]|uniref:Uncharacterized protein n=1 Tax=Ceratodon purpureus TaxID=3225 RepID=A0A8T0HGF9_CERPU|nr:hypothetical protein KC19_6G087600 [Ceratodon purpureus]KAG0613180.1 hypothetical protein M758_6G083100 [Ceratodon purpureus]
MMATRKTEKSPVRIQNRSAGKALGDLTLISFESKCYSYFLIINLMAFLLLAPRGPSAVIQFLLRPSVL